MKTTWCYLTLLAALLLMPGCAGYRLGPTNGMEARSKTIRVAVLVNRTMEPRLAEPVTTALRKRLQQEGTYRLSTSEDADVVLTGTINSFTRNGVSFLSTDVVTVQDYELVIQASITVTERSTGKVLVDNKSVIGRTVMRVANDLTSGERQAVPLVAEDLARNAMTYIVDGTF